jgi:ParB family chromosome partitioning protein
MAQRKALGKGLDALIPQEERAKTAERGEGVNLCPVKDIYPSSHQPRKTIDEASIKGLSRSIKESGIIQPLIVRPRARGKPGWELVAGERRWRAARMAGLDQVPVVVRDMDDREALALSLVENLQREDLNPLEEAEVYQRLMREFNYTQEGLANKVGKDRSTIANSLRLLKLPIEVKKEILSGNLSEGHARVILTMESQARMKELASFILEKRLSVRGAEELANTWRTRPSRRKPKTRAIRARDPFIEDLEDKLKRHLGTRVKIFHRPRRGGRVEIYYYSDEDLERIIGLVRK